jgi:hypothetical protein
MTGLDFDKKMYSMFDLANDTLKEFQEKLDWEQHNMFCYHLMHATIAHTLVVGWTRKELNEDINETIDCYSKEMGSHI